MPVAGSSSRRSFLKRSAGASAGAAFTVVKPALVRGAGKEMLKVGLVGCGGRGSFMLREMLSHNENVRLAAMGDLYEDQLERCLAGLRNGPPAVQSKVAVDAEHRFTGFDAYQKVLASDIDIVMLTVPPVYRPVHFEAAVAARKHIFAEKPLGVDPVGVRRLMVAAQKSEALKLTVMVGAQRRSASDYRQTIQRIRDGAIGKIRAAYAWWRGEAIVKLANRKPGMGDVEYQTRNWYSYLWLSGDQVVEQHIHNIDVVNWALGAHPLKVVASGGVAWRPRTEAHGNIYDHLSADFEYANGVRLSSSCRQFPKGSAQQIGELVVGARGRSNGRDLAPRPAVPSTAQQHIDMIDSILERGPYVNLALPVAESTMTAIMARESAYSGLEISWEQIMNSELELMPPDVEGNPPLGIPDPPIPGQYRFR